MTLPTSLTAPLLEQILRYVPGQRRKIVTDLQKEFQSDWEKRSPSDQDFFTHLHSFIQDPVHRSRFVSIARKHSTKRRSLVLSDAIYAHYILQQPDLHATLKPHSTPADILHVLAQDDDMDRLANIAWAFLEAGSIDFRFLQELFENHPTLKDRFEYTTLGDTHTSAQSPWQLTLKKLIAIIGEVDPEDPNKALANRLLGEATRLYEIADAESLRFWDELRELFTKYNKYVDASDDLQRISEKLIQIQEEGFVPSDQHSVLATIQGALSQYEMQHASIREASEELSTATFEEREQLLQNIGRSNQRQKQSIHAIEDVVNEIPRVDASIDSSTYEDDKSKFQHARRTDDTAEPAPIVPLYPPLRDQSPSEAEGQRLPDAPEDEDASAIDVSELEPLPEGESESHQAEIGDVSGDHPAPSTATESKDDVLPPPPPLLPTEQINVSATQLISDLLAKGHFARAYWIARVSQSFDPNILGALSEGARVKPGSSCHGLLAHFLDELTLPRSWTEDEQLLLVVAVLQPLLFLRTYPESLYQVVSTVPSTPLTGPLEKFRKTYLSQGITLGPQTVHPNIEDVEVEERLQQLSDDAGEFLTRIPSIRFGYKPAEAALRFLYGPNSAWRRLHELVGKGEYGRADEVKTLISELNPKVVGNVHHHIPSLRQQLVGHARDKLTKHLHDTMALASDWLDLVEKQSNRQPRRREQQEQDLKESIISELNDALAVFQDSQYRSAGAAATWHRISDLLILLNGGETKSHDIYDACVELPGIRLDNDMAPPLDNGPAVIAAMKEMNAGKIDPSAVFVECLKRDEFVRANLLIERHDLGQVALDQLTEYRDKRRIEVRGRLNDLHSKVEEAFLLGQLWDSGKETQARTDLLSLVDEGLIKLDGDDSALNINVWEAAALGHQISSRMTEVTAKQLSYLHDEKEILSERFQETERGQSDRLYFETSFSHCLEREDHITAFDLLDRARRAIDQGEPIARSTFIAPSEHLQRFLEFAEDNRESFRRGLTQFVDLIHKGGTVLGIPFGQIDRPRRDDSIAVLNKWTKMSTASQVEEVCRFVGLPVVEGHARLGKRSGDALFHVHIELSHVGPISPLPGFGSMLESHLDVVVSQQPQEPEQVSAFCKEIGVQEGRAVIVLLTRPISSHYRIKWLHERVLRQSMALPLDSCLLMYLCGQRNRLRALLDIGLPHTWAQPYITKGETVSREMFVGRLVEAKDIVDRNGSCIVFGGRQLGKSALLTHVRRESNNPEDQKGLFVAYLDVNDLGEPQTPEEMIEAFWKRISEHLALVGAIETITPNVRRGRRSRWSEHGPSAIEAVLALENERRIVLLLDETDKMLDLDSQLDFALVRRLRILMASTERRFKVVLAGLQSVQRYNNWKNHPFAQLGREIVIDPLPPRAAEDLIVRPFRALGFEFETSELVCRILSMANYHPGLIQIFCYRLLNNLYKSHRQWRSILKKITADDILTIERDQAFREDVRNRFDWTLDLDDRYKVITYGLVLSEYPTTAQTATEFKELGSSWWPGVFDKLDAQDMRAVLDEMVGLGVLLAEHHEDLSRRYRLRSPNLLRLLGPKETIEAELLRIISSDRMSRANPRDFHSVIEEPAVFGPLTREQEGYLSDTSDLFSLVLILGSAALGLRQVGPQVHEVMRSTGETLGTPWEELLVPTTGGVTTTSLMLDGLKRQLSPRQRCHRYAIINFEELVFDEELGNFLKTLLQEMKKLCRSNARGKVFIVLDPRWAWKWICSDLRASIIEDPCVTVMALRRWTEGAVTNALDRIGSRTGSKAAGSRICQLTAGIHEPVSTILERTSRLRKQSGEPVIGIAEEVAGS